MAPCHENPEVEHGLRKPLCIYRRPRANQPPFWALHSYLFHSFNIADAIMEGVNDLNVLNVRDVISGIAEMLDIIVKTLIMLLLDGLEGLGSRRTPIGALEVPDEHGTQLVPGVNVSLK
jgi:hypothetical protein